MDDQEFHLEKTSAARRQLTEAIKLFFEGRDLVAVHTLAAAGRSVVEDIAKSSGVTKSMKHTVEGYIKNNPELKKEVHKAWVETENFLKHADRDTDQSLHFVGSRTSSILFDAVWTYNKLKGESFPAGVLYFAWYFIKSGLINEVEFPEIEKIRAVSKDMDPNNRQQWYKMGQEMGLFAR